MRLRKRWACVAPVTLNLNFTRSLHNERSDAAVVGSYHSVVNVSCSHACHMDPGLIPTVICESLVSGHWGQNGSHAPGIVPLCAEAYLSC